MQSAKRDRAFIWDMLDAAQSAAQFVEGKTYHDYQQNRMLRNAVERNLELIGEAAGKITWEFKEAHPAITWRRLVAQRNILAHEYGEIEEEFLWRVATEHLAPLIAELKALLPPEEENAG